MTRTLAEKLQAWLKQRCWAYVPIVDRPLDSGEPAIVLGGWGAGDLYQGGTNADTLALVGFHRPDTGQALEIAFTVSVHEESGQIDRWEATIAGALEEERAPLLELFHPRHSRLPLNNNMTPRLTFNGARVTS